LFGKSEAVGDATQEVEPAFEYQAFAFIGIGNFNAGVNKMARQGWELVNGCMAGTTNYAYMRRRNPKAAV
jgi:hypothetical protein